MSSAPVTKGTHINLKQRHALVDLRGPTWSLKRPRPLRHRLILRGDALTNEKKPAIWSWQGSFDQQQVLVGVNPDERVIAAGDALRAHVAGHADALFGLAGVATVAGAGTDRAGGAVLALGAVRRG